MTQNEELILSLMDYGKRNAITYEELSNHTGLSNRTVRNVVSNLRKMSKETGCVIMSHSDSKGFWLTKDNDEKRGLINEYKSRISDYWETINAIESTIGVEQLGMEI